jgi:hypothetical protein
MVDKLARHSKQVTSTVGALGTSHPPTRKVGKMTGEATMNMGNRGTVEKFETQRKSSNQIRGCYGTKGFDKFGKHIK